MAPQVGLEPTTLRLTAGCSAIELLRSGRTLCACSGTQQNHIRASADWKRCAPSVGQLARTALRRIGHYSTPALRQAGSGTKYREIAQAAIGSTQSQIMCDLTSVDCRRTKIFCALDRKKILRAVCPGPGTRLIDHSANLFTSISSTTEVRCLCSEVPFVHCLLYPFHGADFHRSARSRVRWKCALSRGAAESKS